MEAIAIRLKAIDASNKKLIVTRKDDLKMSESNRARPVTSSFLLLVAMAYDGLQPAQKTPSIRLFSEQAP